MSISCISNGKVFYKSIEQNVSIGTMFVVFSVMIINSIIGIVLYYAMKGDMEDICNEYGFPNSTRDSKLLQLLLIIMIIVCSILFVMMMSYYYRTRIKLFDLGWTLLIPVIILIVIIVCSIILSTIGDEEIVGSNTGDTKIGNWCTSKHKNVDALVITISSFMGIIIAAFISYLSYVISGACEIA